MIYYVMFVAGVIACALSICFAIRNRRQLDNFTRVLGGGVIFADFLFALPLKDMSIPNAIFFTLKACTTDADYEEIIYQLAQTVTGLNPMFMTVYLWVFVLLCMLSPILFGGIILSLFDGVLERLHYGVVERFHDVYCFSALNEKSFLLAQSIKTSQKKDVVVFCNQHNPANELIEKSRQAGFFLLKKAETEHLHRTTHKRYFFEISLDRERDLDTTKELIQLYTSNHAVQSFENVHIYLFSEQPEAEILLNSTDKKGLQVSIINENSLIAYQLIFQKPLFEATNGNRKLHVLILGSNELARELLKVSLWCGQIEETHPLAITIIDKNAEYLSAVLQKDCPDIFLPEYDIRFIDADTNTVEFKKALDAYCQDANYIMISLGNDEQNIKAAIYLRGYFIKNDADFNRDPIISAAVFNETKHNCVREFTAIDRERIEKKGWSVTEQSSQNYNIYPFGSYSLIYSRDFILNPELESLALNCHAVYELASSVELDDRTIRMRYNISEINRRSSRASAIHIFYKLYCLGYTLKQRSAATQEETAVSAAYTAELLQKLKDNAILETLSKMEHNRWCAFKRCEGYQRANMRDTMIYKSSATGSHVNLRAKLHACLCAWNELDEVAAIYDPAFKEYDIRLITSMPDILGLVENEKVNISKTEYVLMKNGNGTTELSI